MAEPIRTIDDAARWLEGLINVEKLPDRSRARLSLGPIAGLLAALGHPERRLRPVHVAGSKGKGSTALLLEALLCGAGLRVGTFTSPHLVRWTERFRIDGAEVPGATLAAAVERVRPFVEEARRAPAPPPSAHRGAPPSAHQGAPPSAHQGAPPSWFDVTTAVGLLLFAEAELDAVILEVGLGGRLDSTNVVAPALCCITSIELEHTEILGDTLAAVAGEKAGILKPGVPLVLGSLPPAARDVVLARAAELAVPVAELGVDFSGEDVGTDPTGVQPHLGVQAHLRDGALDVRTTLATLGDVQVANAALALACARRLPGVDAERLARSAPASLAGAALPGRVEALSRDPLLLVDAAHTEQSARVLARALERLPAAPGGRTHLVLAVSRGKNLAALLEALAPHADVVTLTRAEPVRSLQPAEIAAALRAVAPGLEPRVVPNPHLALRAAREGARPGDRVVATGSIYLAGLARELFAGPPAPALVSRRPGRRGADA